MVHKMTKLYLTDGYNSIQINDDDSFAGICYTTSLKTYILKEDTEIFTKDGKHYYAKKGDGVACVSEYDGKEKKNKHFFFKLDADSLKEYSEFLKEKYAHKEEAAKPCNDCESETDCDAAC